MDIPGGQFQKQSQEYSSRVKGKFQCVDELKNLGNSNSIWKEKIR